VLLGLGILQSFAIDFYILSSDCTDTIGQKCG